MHPLSFTAIVMVALSTTTHPGDAYSVSVSRRQQKSVLASATSSDASVLPSSSSSLSYDLNAWKGGFTTPYSEACQILEGKVPTDLKGTYFRNGYGKFEVGTEKVLHPFDADGLMNAITIQDGTAIFRNR